MISQTLSHYKIINKIGAGGMGEVYLAQDTSLGRQVALKLLPVHLTGDKDRVRRFKQEARAASALNHPNILTIHEIGEADGHHFIATEFIEGETLRRRLKESRIEIGAALDVALQVASALAAAHAKGIVHRDIKPDNIMLRHDGYVKVLDFGLAKLTEKPTANLEASMWAETQPGVVFGTVQYMSPEQARGQEVDGRTDIWSLGVVLYEVVSGRAPHGGGSAGDMIASILEREPPPLTSHTPEAPSELERIVHKCLKKDREQRYQSMEEILDDLKRLKREIELRGAAATIINVSSYSSTAGLSEKLKKSHDSPGVPTRHIALQTVRRVFRPGIAIPAFIMVLVLCVLAGWFFKRQAKVKWAREQALPQIEGMIANSWRDSTEAYKLAEEAEKYIPNDPVLANIFSKISLKINVTTEPSGAKIYVKQYSSPDSEWNYVGLSPVEQLRMPLGIFRWKIEKEGYESVLAAATTFDVDIAKENLVAPYKLTRVLDEQKNARPEMVRVSGATTRQGKVDDFYIDRYEVTNQDYKKFVDSGGYRRKEYWKNDFREVEKVLTWEEAIGRFVDQTLRPGPAGWQAGNYPEGQGNYPVSGISWYEAAAYAEFAGKSLPTQTHWGLATGASTPLLTYPQLGGFAVFAPFSNFHGKGPVSVGSLPGITPYGAYDMAGNVREWCWNETPRGRLIRGGAWGDNTYMFGALSQAPPMDRSVKNGFRCALYPDSDKIPPMAFEAVQPPDAIDYYREQPVPDSVFQVYKEQFSYDKTPLNAQVESKKENPDWLQEKITFDAAYGGERVIAYLFLPKHVPPPYQTVIYFPGSASAWKESSKDIENYYEFPLFLSFIVTNGRAVLYPVYKGTFERRVSLPTGDPSTPDDSHAFRDYQIQLVKDFRRSVDYLESRPDIASKKLAYYGMSWGGSMGALIPAVEDRLQTSILVASGFIPIPTRPEVRLVNYVTRVKIPTLILNGKYDTIFPPETSSKPLFDLLGTPKDQKELKLYETDHIPPRNEFIKETLAWLDRYLGPVNR
jgi:serine/threonine protein kinase/formylglycine-generating enzyme required for sulfatase activity/cephalosporin-C deacetylase-like acetyl esterase